VLKQRLLNRTAEGFANLIAIFDKQVPGSAQFYSRAFGSQTLVHEVRRESLADCHLWVGIPSTVPDFITADF